ncbi:MAG: beta-phosphoglucomutase [Flavobacteriales bacterium CG_4_9_14_3_um_filter_40_17]|nr:MAG: beta-phosphoglucomutase [Flavobacteriales bacterium CG_4_9_14_3_um_filter_40_17]
MTKKAFIFDLDGVIVDTAKFHYLAWKKLADELGIPFTQHDNEQLKGVSRVRSLELILNLGGVTLDEVEKLNHLKEKNEDYLSYISEMTHADVLPNVPKVLNFLKAHQVPIALGSASKNAKQILEKVGLLGVFDAIVDGNEVSKAKPDPEVFLLAARKIDANPEDCVVFEDAIAGIQAANQAKMLSIGIGESEILHEAKYVFRDFTKISTKFLAELLK